jgi:hypothetical protein
MINRTLSKRVQKLEARLIPSSEPRIGPPFPVTTTDMGAWMGRILNASGTLPGNFPS